MKFPSTSGKLQPPKASDAVPEGLCPSCGLKGEHPTPAACSDVLRDRIALLEFLPRRQT
jgi:hypothetical protein